MSISKKKSLTKASIPLWMKKDVLVWLEILDKDGQEIEEYQKAIIKEIFPEQRQIQILKSQNNQIENVSPEKILQRMDHHNEVKDLAEIPILNDAELMAHLHLLYLNDKINVFCGPSLIVVNPYKRIENELSSKTFSLIQSCYEKKQLDLAPPHVWTIAAFGLQQLDDQKKNQAICINGESGAGKTVSTKMCLEFLTSLDKKYNPHDQEDLSTIIMSCNPVLEAFGNAKTTRNDNSSRFGKYVKLFYELKGQKKILGSTNENYLLEKSRVISPAKDERSFHVFYAMCQFMPDDQKKKYHLFNNGMKCQMSYFENLKKSGIYTSPNINDLEIYQDITESFQKLNFTENEIDAIWRILSAILYMGNLRIDDSEYEEGKTPVKLVQNQDYQKVIKLLGCDENQFNEALTLKVRKIMQNVLKTPYKPEQIADYIGSMSKDLYNKMFNWIINKMNQSLVGTLDPKMVELGSVLPDHIRSIGILDIFGFEIFENNYLEQLFINYANERLQGLYIDHIFKNECKFFVSEGLDKYVDLIVYDDNIDLIRVLDQPKGVIGVFPLTNEMSQLNKTDDQLMATIKKTFAKEQKGLISFHKMKKNIFYIKHTARDVEYTIDKFIEKNKDEISKGIQKAIESCLPSIVRIYQNKLEDQSLILDDENSKSDKQKFLAFKFTRNMDELIQELNNSNCQFVRCVKPNEVKKKDFWVEYLVLKQITYMGLLNSLKIRKQNYVFRFTYEEFFLRYKDLDLRKEGGMTVNQLKRIQPNWREISTLMLQDFDKKPTEKDILMGKTKILINDHYKNYLDIILRQKQKIKRDALKVISDFYLANKQRKKIHDFIRQKAKVIMLAKATLKGINAKIEYVKFKKRISIIRKFQSNFRRVKIGRVYRLKKFNTEFIFQYYKLFQIKDSIYRIYKVQKTFSFLKVRLRFLLYKARKRICKRIVQTIFKKAWGKILFKQIDYSASLVQASFRSYLFRQQNLQKYQDLNAKAEQNQILEAVIKVQSHIRKFLVICRLERLTIAAKTIQRYFKMIWLRDYFQRLVKSAIIIQRFVRRYLHRTQFLIQKFQDVINNSKYTLVDVQRKEYLKLFNERSFYEPSKTADHYYQHFLKQNELENEIAQKMIPEDSGVSIKKRAKYFSLLVDFSTRVDTNDFYSKLWGDNFWEFLNSIHTQDERLLHLKIGDQFTYAITDKLNVYNWGCNFNYQLCRKTKHNFAEKVSKVQSLSKNKGQDISISGKSPKMLCQNGLLLMWGNSSFEEVGLGQNAIKEQLIVQNEIEQKIEHIISQGNLTYFLDNKGKVFTFNSNYLPNTRDWNQIQNLNLSKKIVEISAGSNFLIMRAENGSLHAFGENDKGQLGQKNLQSINQPLLISSVSKGGDRIDEISCGYKHVIARTYRGEVLTWGDNSLFQLGYSTQDLDFSYKPQKIVVSTSGRKGYKIVSIAAGFGSSYFLRNDKYLFFCGETGVGNLKTVKKIPYIQRYFYNKNNLDFKPLRILTSWSKNMSVAYLVFLDFRSSEDHSQQQKDKLANLLLENWDKSKFLPNYHEKLQNFVSRKYFLQYQNQDIVEVTNYKNKSVSRKLKQNQQKNEIEQIQINQNLYDREQQIPVNQIFYDEDKQIKEVKNQKISKRNYQKFVNKYTQPKKQPQNKRDTLMSLLEIEEKIPKKDQENFVKGIANSKQKKMTVDDFEKELEQYSFKKSISKSKAQNKNSKISKYNKSKLSNEFLNIDNNKKNKSSRIVDQKISYLHKNKSPRNNKQSRQQISQKSIPSQIKNSDISQKSNIFEKVQKIMKKDTKKWTKVEKEIMNSYVKLTQGLFNN